MSRRTSAPSYGGVTCGQKRRPSSPASSGPRLSVALGVYGPRELERIRVGEIHVCGGDGKDNTGIVWVAGQQARNSRSARVTYQLGLEMYSRTRLRICLSISLGWSTTGIYVQPRSASCQFTKQTYLGKSWKIDRGEVEHCRAVYPHVGRQPGHAVVLARDTERVLFDLAPDLGEVDEAFCEVEELAPLVATRGVD
jgi:hypothetical protein